MGFELRSDLVEIGVGDDGTGQSFVDRSSGQNYLRGDELRPFARMRVNDAWIPVVSATREGDTVMLGFPDGIGDVQLEVKEHTRHIELGVQAVSCPGMTELVFVDLATTCEPSPGTPFAACALALNLQTNVEELPGFQEQLWAYCCSSFGLVDARVALIGSAPGDLRPAMQDAVSCAHGLPDAPLGGPWALDHPDNRESYIFGNPGEDTVDTWVEMCYAFGINQIDFCGCLRYGDYEPNPALFPNGRAGVKATTDRFHEAGIKAGLHTLSFSIGKSCPWVTPIPDPRLGKEQTFTLAADLDETTDVVPVEEPTDGMPTHVGYHIRRSVTLQIGDELIEYSGIEKGASPALTGCKRGACGTTPAPHPKGAPVHHLKECWGCFAPDGESTLYDEVAGGIADTLNECGFDMVYLDGLDGSHVIGGESGRWHYGSRFAFEVTNRLSHPVIMEMAAFHHHLWFLRSRMGAWDHPARGHKAFIDVHCWSNRGFERILLPGHLGWWSPKTWAGPCTEPTYPDVVEYLCCKSLGTGAGFSLQGVSPADLGASPFMQRLAQIFRRYGELRRQADLSPELKEQLSTPGIEMKLLETDYGEPYFRPVHVETHTISLEGGREAVWRVHNPHSRQALRIRIEGLLSAEPHDSDRGVVLADFQQPGEFSDRRPFERILNSGKRYTYAAAAPGMSLEVGSGPLLTPPGEHAGRVIAAHRLTDERAFSSAPDDAYSLCDHGERIHRLQLARWARVGKLFDPVANLGPAEALGFWVHGDGQGALLNFQLNGPDHNDCVSDHYVTVDFEGWRYFELIEPETDRFEAHSWPYNRCVYKTYRERFPYSQLAQLSLWVNDVPAGGRIECHVGPIKALPTVREGINNPVLTVNGHRMALPIRIRSGWHLELRGKGEARLYDEKGNTMSEVKPEGGVPLMEPGENELRLTCTPDAYTPRVRVTVTTESSEHLVVQ